MRILIVNTYHYLRGGDSRYAFGLADLLKKEGHEVHFLGMKGQGNQPTDDEEYFVSEIDYREANKRRALGDALRVASRSIYSFEAKRNIARMLNKVKPDLVHLNAFRHHITMSILGEVKRHNIPTIRTLHSYKELCPNTTFYDGQDICEDCKGKRYRSIVRKKCKKGSLSASIMTYLEAKTYDFMVSGTYYDLSIAPSRFILEKYIEYGYDLSKIVHLPNFVDVQSFVPSYGHEKYLAYIGRLEREKGVLTLIKGFSKAANGMPGLSLKIAGTGSMENDLRHFIGQAELGKVELLGYKEGDELENLTKNATAVVVPSEWYENYPYSCLEAMAYGKPVIGARIGGIPEQVDDGVTGLLFEPKNDEQLANCIEVLCGLSNDRVIEMGKRGRKKVETENDPESHLKTICRIYERLLRTKGLHYD